MNDHEYKKQIQSFFDDFADSWDDRFQGTKASLFFKEKRLKMMAQYLGAGYASLLEVGCGTGYHIMRLVRPGQRGVGIDVAERMLERARVIQKERFPDTNITFSVDDGEHLSLADNSFDRVIFVGYLIHLQNPQQAVGEIHRVLTPGGRVVGLVSNRWSPWISLKLRKAIANDYGALPRDQEFSPPEVRRLMMNAGFKNVRLVIFNSLPGRLPDWAYYPGRLLNYIFSVWPFSRLGFHIMVIADKD